jgi:hypothetical protein
VTNATVNASNYLWDQFEALELGHFIQDLGYLVHPANVAVDRAIFFLQSDSEAKLGRAEQAQAFELPKQFTPGLAAFVISKRKRQAIRHPGFF